MSDGEQAAKLSSVFSKKKKKGGFKSSTVNATAIVSQSTDIKSNTLLTGQDTGIKIKSSNNIINNKNVHDKVFSTSNMGKTSSKNTNSPDLSPSQAPSSAAKVLTTLSISENKDDKTKGPFQWAKQPKKYKDTSQGGVAKTWEEQEERNRRAKKLNLESERAFPTLGGDSTKAQIQGNKAMKPKGVETKNTWATLSHDDEDSE